MKNYVLRPGIFDNLVLDQNILTWLVMLWFCILTSMQLQVLLCFCKISVIDIFRFVFTHMSEVNVKSQQYGYTSEVF